MEITDGRAAKFYAQKPSHDRSERKKPCSKNRLANLTLTLNDKSTDPRRWSAQQTAQLAEPPGGWVESCPHNLLPIDKTNGSINWIMNDSMYWFNLFMKFMKRLHSRNGSPRYARIWCLNKDRQAKHLKISWPDNGTALNQNSTRVKSATQLPVQLAVQRAQLASSSIRKQLHGHRKWRGRKVVSDVFKAVRTMCDQKKRNDSWLADGCR